MASNNTGETATTSSVIDNPVLATPNTEAASAGPSSSSYANVVLSLKPTQQGINENNKENIGEINQSKAAPTPPVAVAREINQQEPAPTVPQNKEHKTEKTPTEDEDDSNFTPVVAHSRKERNSRVKRRARDRPQGGRGAVGGANRDDAHPQSRSSVGGAALAKEKDAKKRNRNKSTENASHGSGDQQSTKSSIHSQGEEDEDGQDESSATKFVDAPIPKENAWKVSLIFLVLKHHKYVYMFHYFAILF